ncbi:heavy metal translocating P-type ATPase [Truepera radiovictrix DSM 17093]|uniref:Heavy metal translocating P-type ATPase n=1 Tax=Truepera radiovictrix (strain DSM 17093 / CIP 108686 / LMG 22925 / RQ-24) TaxID=649638 RepID=D7CY62_TRURR|nr:heavy metal translocating P-type ATPase [Truepera radiovictrix DSM 17093]
MSGSTNRPRRPRSRHRLATCAQGDAATRESAAEQLTPATPWYRTGAGGHALCVGVLFAMAVALSLALPERAPWAYALTTLVGAWPLARKAASGALAGRPFGMSTLVSLAALGALLIGEAAEGALVVTLFLLGERLEGVAAARARRSVSALAALTPKTARVLEAGGVRVLSAASLRPGQRVRVAPGERIPADGVVLEGASTVDESPLTGESVPRSRGVGEAVFAGSVNGEGALTVAVTRPGDDNLLARTQRLVDEAQRRRSRSERLIDRFSRRYTPGVLAAALLAALLPPLVAGAAWETSLYRALALLLIGCPCALVLGVPAAMTSALAAGARRGLLVKGGAVFEALARVRTVALDKTGTLSQARLEVTDVVPLGRSAEAVLELAGAVEATSAHPLAQAITAHARAAGLSLPEVSAAQALPGRAVAGTVGDVRVVVASPRYAALLTPLGGAVRARVAALEAAGKTVAVTLVGGEVAGLIALRDAVRPEARRATEALRALGLRVVVLTGDNRRAAAALAAPLGLEVRAELLPEAKLRLVERLGPGVMMVGDGINDAPALARADVGVAMGGGTDVALETADAALLRAELTGVADLVALARRALRTVRANIAIALGLKALFLATTLLGVTGLWAAILADTGATALVTANALRLLRPTTAPRPGGR